MYPLVTASASSLSWFNLNSLKFKQQDVIKLLPSKLSFSAFSKFTSSSPNKSSFSEFSPSESSFSNSSFDRSELSFSRLVRRSTLAFSERASSVCGDRLLSVFGSFVLRTNMV